MSATTAASPSPQADAVPASASGEGEKGSGGGADSKVIKSATSAFLFYQRENMGRIRQELEAKGEPSGLGDVQKVVASEWRSLADDVRAVYNNKAAEDRARYDAECAERDRLLDEESARRRREREDVICESRMRVREEREEKVVQVRQKRELSAAEIEERETIKAERAARQAVVDAEHHKLAEERAKQAEARLQFLLRQSDIFTHFGLTGGKTTKAGVKKEQGEGSGTSAVGAKHRRAAAADEDEDMEGGPEAHFLLAQPPSIKHGQLRPYQLEGLNWMIRLQDNGINGILADEMGLGKTLQSISVLAYNAEFLNTTGPHLILVPKSTLSNWCNEFRKWCPSLRVLRFHGSKDERADLIAERLSPGTERDWDVLLTTYEICNLEKGALSKFAWQYLIIDEAHRLKNEASQFSQTVRMLKTAHRLLITGTPLQNNLHELWALLNFLLPDVFSSSDQFDDWFNLEIDDAEQKQRLITQLHKILRPFMLRRLKADVEKSLPKKTETLVFCEMMPTQRDTYKKILERDLSVIAGSETAGRTAVLNLVMQLRKACNHPYLFTGVEDRTLDPLGDHVIKNCGKMYLLDKLLKKLKEKGHRVLVFCQMTRMLDILEDFMYMRGHSYCRIDGNTSYEERENLIDTYNAPNSSKFAFLLSTRAGGLGINLQTADTVILYDSDWNPQADLQAQDRAHRIGQKRPVNIYRLVTQGTIEEKIVERAQKKLKLDAMVVQQGRLQDKDKMSKDELLEALRFGADVIFRSKDNNITDEDIDLILERGRKRTLEIEEKLKAADKGDLLDFRMDGGMSVQVFEGQDYSKKPGKETFTGLPQLQMFDIGKRERRPTQSNLNEGALLKRMAVDGKIGNRGKHMKLPKQLRLPRIDDVWTFYDRERLRELQKMEEDRYRELKNNDALPSDPAEWELLTPVLAEEKARLLSEGFGDWSRNHFNLFCRASAKYGRTSYEKIAGEIGKTEEEVQRYAEVFWRKGEEVLSDGEWKKVVTAIEKGEKKLEEIARLTKATQELLSRFKNPWEELSFHYIGQQGKERIYSTEEDRYLLCFTNHYGYGNWEDVRMAIRRCDRFRFDYFLRSCTADNLGKRCEQLMRAAEKENIEYEKKRLAVEDGRRREKEDRSVEDARRIKDDEERKARITELDAKLGEEEGRLQEFADAKKAAEMRLQLLKGLKVSSNGGLALDGIGSSASLGGGGGVGGGKGTAPKTVPEELVPELAMMVVRAGADGVTKIVAEFHGKYAKDGVSKRQIEMKINEIAVKERREEDARPIWHLRDDFTHLVKGRVTPKGEKKRKREGAGEGGEGGELREPKKARNAVTLYLVDHKEQVKRELGAAATNENIKSRIKALWRGEAPHVKDKYTARAREEEARYDREMNLYQTLLAQEEKKKATAAPEASTNPSTTSSVRSSGQGPSHSQTARVDSGAGGGGGEEEYHIPKKTAAAQATTAPPKEEDPAAMEQEKHQQEPQHHQGALSPKQDEVPYEPQQTQPSSQQVTDMET